MSGLFIFTSNRMEVLAERLAEVLRTARTSAMTPETIIVQSRGMERWVSMELARRNGISANVRFPFPNAFLEEAFRAVSTQPAQQPPPFDPGVLTFRIMGLIDTHFGRPEFESLQHFLADDAQGVKGYQLARKIGDLFDQYLVFRPEMIAQWETGQGVPAEHHRWQALIWRELARTAAGLHRAAQRRLLAEAIRRGEPGLAALPRRISLFGVSYLPRFHLELFAELSKVVDVHVFCMNPCREYWADIVSERAVHRWQRQAAGDDTAESPLHLERGNRLLASLGTLGRHFLDMLTDVSGFQDERFVEPGGDSLLGRLQADILDLNDPRPADGLVPDGSIRIHACHSPMREAEVLKDQLLAMFEADPQLRPGDVIVMTPDIEAYAPFISAVFGTPASPGQRIPFSIADRGLHRESGCLRAFFQLLELKNSRFGAGEVLRLLEAPALLRRFGIEDAHFPRLEQWVRMARICWGVDETTQRSLGLPEHPHHTWRAGIERLLMGYALAAEGTEVFHGVRGCNAFEGGDARMVGLFLDFLDQVFALAARLREARGLEAWRSEINAILAAFFPEDDGDLSELQRIRRILDEMADLEASAGYRAAVPLEIVRLFLTERLEGEGVGRGFMSGGVTFCSMLPMRTIPFKVVCLIGMNHDAFPRESRQLTFDLIAQAPRPGDRSRRNDDKYLFLEALLSARSRLYISYVGQSIQDNSRVPPSVVVSELLDALQTGYGLAAEDSSPPLVTFHPLQPFSASYFRGGPALFSYSAEDLQAAAAASAPAWAKPFFPEPLPLTAEEDTFWRRLDIARLSAFFANPAKFIVRERLGISLGRPPETDPDREPFALSGIERFAVGNHLLEQRLKGCQPEQAFAALRADGVLPHATAGEVEFRALWSEVERFARRLDGLRPSEVPAELDARWEIAGFSLAARIRGLSGNRWLRYRFGKLRAKDLLEIWLRHMALCLAAPERAEVESVFVCTDRTLRLKPVAESRAILGVLLGVYRRGLERPLCFFPQTALEYATTLRRSTPERALSAARNVWEGSDLHPGESADPYYRRCFEAIDPLGIDFAALSRQVFEPLLEHVGIEKAA
jgi:exodeoxyribonuclease V gamma subunit